ncbi:MAG: RNase adapter RapZ [Acidobacteria bacterium]|nr:RNase adapter RapZ [Acidobacteriota bacterium]
MPASSARPRTPRKAARSLAGRNGDLSAPPRSNIELVVITGMSGSGKASVLKAFEDLGYYCVDNLPVELMPRFAELIKQSPEITRAALVVDVREGQKLERLPQELQQLKEALKTTVIFLEASDDVLLRRFSETRRPHPLSGRSDPVRVALRAERKRLGRLRDVADIRIDTSKFNVHELRAYVISRFQREQRSEKNILVSCVSFGYKNGVPPDSDLVFDVRFLPNPHFVPEFRPLTGKHPKVAKYILSFPQSREFISRISEMLIYLLPHYVREGKSYLTIAFGCTGGQHRSVMIAEEVQKRLRDAGYNVKITHRDSGHIAAGKSATTA